MAGREGKRSPTPTEQDDCEDEGNIIDHDEAQENDETTLNYQYRELDSQVNTGEENRNATADDAPTEAVMGSANDVVPAQETAQATNNTTRQAQLEFNIEVMTEDPNAGPGLEEQLGGVFVEETGSPNGVRYPLFTIIDTSSAIPSEV